MLREIETVRQFPGEPHRRWFADEHFDLIVWDRPDGELIGFQLCYRTVGQERALTWMKGKGFSHDGVDDGETHVLGPKMTPILVPDGQFSRDSIRAEFQNRAARIDPRVAAFILDILDTYPARGLAVKPPTPTRGGPRASVRAQRPTVRTIRRKTP